MALNRREALIMARVCMILACVAAIVLAVLIFYHHSSRR
jgi:hypothetical protein